MKFDPEIHQRRSIRLASYDYSSIGFYFVTICIQNRKCLLGKIVDSEVVLNDAGWMVDHWWCELTNKFSTVGLDHYVIMPNHLHGILILQSPVGADQCVCPDPDLSEYPGGHTDLPLPKMIQWFKTMPTNAYIRGVNNNCWPPFPGKLWQRNYYERIIRNEGELHNTRQYIRDNPMQWVSNKENPANHQNHVP